MPHPAQRIVAGFVLFALAVGSVAGQSASERPTRGIAREAIRDFKFRPPPATHEEIPAVLKSKAEKPDAPVMLPAYVVRGLPDQTFQRVKDALATQKRLESGALLKKERFETLLPPKLETTRQGEPRFELPILRLRF
jgi:hypothetical protein